MFLNFLTTDIWWLWCQKAQKMSFHIKTMYSTNNTKASFRRPVGKPSWIAPIAHWFKFTLKNDFPDFKKLSKFSTFWNQFGSVWNAQNLKYRPKSWCLATFFAKIFHYYYLERCLQHLLIFALDKIKTSKANKIKHNFFSKKQQQDINLFFSMWVYMVHFECILGY